MANKESIKKHNWKPLAKIIGYADAEVAPIDFCISPSDAMKKCLKSTGLNKNDISYYEINEAFAVTTLANMKIMNIPHS